MTFGLILLLVTLPLPSVNAADRSLAARTLLGDQTLDGRTIDDWKRVVLPKENERAADEIDWIPSFSGGLEEAGRHGRPMLLWLMNGHPLGCT